MGTEPCRKTPSIPGPPWKKAPEGLSEDKEGVSWMLLPASFRSCSHSRAPPTSRTVPDGPLPVVWQQGEADKVPSSGQVLKVEPRDKETMEEGGKGLRVGGA